MTDNDQFEYEKISRALHDAKNAFRKMNGEEPLPYMPRKGPFCSFCGKSQNEVAVLVQGPSVFICNECVKKSQAIIDGQSTDENR